MRISDWSSDVCSSDLGGSVRLADLVVDLLEVVDHGVNDRGLGGVVDLVGVVAVVISHTLLVATRDGDGVRVVCDLSRDGVDRKSVVSGTSVSVSVDYGGRRTLQKKQ